MSSIAKNDARPTAGPQCRDTSERPVANPSPGGDVTGHVLVVDDESLNRELLVDNLAASGFSTAEATDGEGVFAQIELAEPDVILLDVMIPKIDGFDVCRRLKQDPSTSHIPILLVTALQHQVMARRGISAGADDFIRKPFDVKELVLRTRNAIRMKQLLDLAKDLQQVRKEFVSMVVHDMRSPLQAIAGTLELLAGSELAPPMRPLVSSAIEASHRLSSMGQSMLDIHRLEEATMPVTPAQVGIHALVAEACRSLGSPGNVENRVDRTLSAYCDPHLTFRILVNLIENALKHSRDSDRTAVAITAVPHGGTIVVRVTDNGPGIPPEYQKKIFALFGRVPVQGGGDPIGTRSTGLGLAFCKVAVDAQGGEIGIACPPSGGSTFFFSLPNGAPEGGATDSRPADDQGAPAARSGGAVELFSHRAGGREGADAPPPILPG